MCMGPTTGVVPGDTGPQVPGVSVERPGPLCTAWVHQGGFLPSIKLQLVAGEPGRHQRVCQLAGAALGACVWVSTAGNVAGPGTFSGQTKCLETASRRTHMLCI